MQKICNLHISDSQIAASGSLIYNLSGSPAKSSWMCSSPSSKPGQWTDAPETQSRHILSGCMTKQIILPLCRSMPCIMLMCTLKRWNGRVHCHSTAAFGQSQRPKHIKAAAALLILHDKVKVANSPAPPRVVAGLSCFQTRLSLVPFGL